MKMDARDVGVAVYVLICTVAGIIGGIMVGMALGSLELLWFYSLQFLYRKRLITRLAPSIDMTMSKYRKESFMAVSIAPMPLAALLFAGRNKYLESAYVSFDLAGAYKFCWISMAVHDAYFWAVHTLLHRVKSVYRRVHRLHHSTGGDISVFSTAYGEWMDIALCVTPFYAGLMAWVYSRPAWNVVEMAALAWAVNGVNVMGHCGYRLPAWVYGPGSFGILLTPFAQTPKHHLIHHLHPTSNRALYFTWWDRLGGSYGDTHPKIHN